MDPEGPLIVPQVNSDDLKNMKDGNDEIQTLIDNHTNFEDKTNENMVVEPKVVKILYKPAPSKMMQKYEYLGFISAFLPP